MKLLRNREKTEILMKYCLQLPVLILLILFASCSKDIMPVVNHADIVGKWTLNQVYANDFWGGPLHWKPATSNSKIRFTEQKYYYFKQQTDTDFVLFGKYELLSDSTIRFIPIKKTNFIEPYVLRYSFENGGFLNLGYNQFEGVVEEKYKYEQ